MNDSLEDINWVRIAFFTAVAVGYFFVMKSTYPDAKYFFPYSVVHILAIVWLISIGKAVVWRSRYVGYQVTVDGCSGSIFGKPEYVPDPSLGPEFYWAVFNLGFSLLPPLRGKLGTLVVPADQVYPAGKNFVGLTLVSKWPLGLLPNAVNFYLRQNEGGFNQKNIFFGKYSKHFIDNSGEEIDLNKQVTAKDSLLNVQGKMIENKFDSFEEVKEFADRMTGNRFSLKKLFTKVTKDEVE